ncbi:hypothetical protein SDC9_136709 [bioreactor metagenome]|uniref:Uncharacterized protein n=1 Tax=bioreactor metagenome TaxID=1076179 RepID=A0A645DJZ9_9ZZZZ
MKNQRLMNAFRKNIITMALRKNDASCSNTITEFKIFNLLVSIILRVADQHHVTVFKRCFIKCFYQGYKKGIVKIQHKQCNRS